MKPMPFKRTETPIRDRIVQNMTPHTFFVFYALLGAFLSFLGISCTKTHNLACLSRFWTERDMTIEKITPLTRNDLKEAIYQIISSHCKSNGYFNQTNYMLSSMFKVRPDLISECIKDLENEGLIDVKGANINFKRNRKIYVKVLPGT